MLIAYIPEIDLEEEFSYNSEQISDIKHCEP